MTKPLEKILARHNKNAISRSKIPAKQARITPIYRKPFWLPTVSYYFLSVAIAIIFFFLVWAILHEGGEATPWIPAGILASLVLIGAVILREIYLRKARNRYLLVKRQLDYNLSKIPNIAKTNQTRPKFTLQQNSYMLNHIKEKSDAARVLKRLPEGHFEVFEICNEYLNFTENELNKIDYNSPRFIAIKKGRRNVRDLHKYHLIKWAEIETKTHTRDAKIRATVVGKVETAQKALTVLESALRYYPKEENLIASYEAVAEFISRTKISHRIEEAEKSAFNEDYLSAIEQYGDILFLLTKENLSKRDKNEIKEKIELEINKLNILGEQNKNLELNPDQVSKEND